ncbi:cytochrome P450 [Cucurbitaria berberidis CBS 394.84]|uniref:Cytochrome P450 n=1 Tax=Cucurbitaria berberidis CBS 394.84 TaxID=1168544 RepID=A0A9P4GD01_9PLEO|nr:cytochrome P450 [Cucurbitaria berberidis CBS 394.84]KAF1843633.1 cytochrome P450 [Cucurbitaria berberidis CBS 394.84]
MFAAVLLTLLALPALLFAWSALSLQANKAKAETTGLPLLVRWVAPTNPLWMMFGSSIVLKCRALGIGTKRFHRFYVFSWEANERHVVHQELGPVFMLVSPGGNWLCVSDASVFEDVIHRRTDFRRNMEQFAVLNVYGKNLSTTDDEEWQKHRKVTAITFTEKNNELVWQESLSQTRGMLKYWLQHQPVSTTHQDTKVFTLNVLAAAIFNKSYPFEGAAESKEHVNTQDASYQYRDSLSKILANIIPIFICGEQGLKAWWTPKSWKSAGTAIATFRAYVAGLINDERDYMDRGIQKNQHLVAALVRACEDETRQPIQGKRNMTLTEEEIVSNLFVYAFAGNDTTAISLNHLLVDLAASPETQEWIAEEIRHYLPEDDISLWAYKRFSKLKRCLAVVMESIRINHPLGQLAKQTGQYSQQLKIGSRNITIPPGTSIHLSLAALHTHPQYWGEDSLKWNPSRFISTPDGAGKDFENEVLASDTQEHFLPWATGQRVCPGKKFSQVELVAALAFIFRDYCVHPQPLRNESMEQARKRIFNTGMEIEHEGTILHELRYPESIALNWSKRER